MKALLLFVSFTSLLVNAQTFAPFNENVPKRFFQVDDPTLNDYYFYPYQTEVFGDVSTFFQYFRRVELEVPIGDSCSAWGSDMGLSGDTTWLGREIVYDASIRTLTLENKAEALLSFDFSLAFDDSAVFYSNAESEYYIKYNAVALETVYGTEDLVKTFTVLHYNLDGEAVLSPLHTFEIKLGESIGLTRFIDCHNFPETEVGVDLMGQLHPTIGKYQMTYDEAFPWDIGDLLQYRSTLYNYEFGAVNKTYRMITVTDRTETVDSVFIALSSTSFTVYDPADEIFPYTYSFGYGSSIAFKKGENISEEPSGMMPYVNHYQFTDSTEYCGNREQLKITPDFLAYCEGCQCDLPFDGFGTTYYNKTYGTGLGTIATNSITYGEIMAGTSASLIYSNVGGETCGTEAFASIQNEAHSFSIYPNPVQDILSVDVKTPVNTVSVLNLNGEVMLNKVVTAANFEISVAHLPAGVYIIAFISDGSKTFSRFVKA